MMKGMSFSQAQKLFLKLSFFLKQTNLTLQLPPNTKETLKIFLPNELSDDPLQIASLQYGGVKYPMIDRNQVNYKYIELRLKGQFLRDINQYEAIYELLKQTDANDWIKYKFTYSNEDLRLAKRIRDLIIKGLEHKYGFTYLTIGIDKSIIDLPRNVGNSTNQLVNYNQQNAIKIISDMLLEKGYKVSRASQKTPTHHLIVATNKKTAKVRVKHLQFDSAYHNSPLPYQVYKIDAFDTVADQKTGLKDIDFIVGYNFRDNSFTCLDIDQYIERRSRVVHQREGQNSEYYNSLQLLIEFLGEEITYK